MARPVCGSATADTSATVRPGQAGSCCHRGLSNQAEQLEPAAWPFASTAQAVSDQPRLFAARVSVVPPTAVTVGRLAGNEAASWYPVSPEEAVMATPGWS